MVTRNLRRRLAGGEAAVDFGPLEMLACATRPGHTRNKNTSALKKR
jgi:hypothetical protein